MKELSIEEKARAYDKAIERAKEWYNNPNSNSIGKSYLYAVFPELKESEDERIRKELISFFIERAKYTEDSTFNGLSSKEIIAWLEKQGNINPTEDELEALRMAAYEPTKNWSEKLQSLYEKLTYCKQSEQNPADKVEPKFKVGQTIKKEGFNLEFTIVKIEDGFYYNDMGDCFPFTDQDNWELVEQKSWSEEDEKEVAVRSRVRMSLKY